MSKQTSRAVIKEFRDGGYGIASDITKADGKQLKELNERERAFDVVLYSRGAYGLNGVLLKGWRTGRLYAITDRTAGLFALNFWI